MTEIKSNGPVTALSNPADRRHDEVRHAALVHVVDDLIVWHPGCYGPRLGWTWRNGMGVGAVLAAHLDALERAGLIVNGPPSERRSDGNPVQITEAGDLVRLRAILRGAA